MRQLLTAAQMRALEQAAIARGEVTGLELMERAGQGVVGAIYAQWPEFERRGAAPAAGADWGPNWGPTPKPPRYLKPEETGPLRAVVLCGPGNNGGDGYVVARALAARGWAVDVYAYGDVEKLPADARVNYERWGASVGSVLDYQAQDTWACDLIVDALFGIGISREVPELGELFWNMEDMVDCFEPEAGHADGRPAIVAIDMPSGLCADSGRVFEYEDAHDRFAACAHLTVTFHAPKLGHYLAEGPGLCATLKVCDIGLEDQGKKDKSRKVILNDGLHRDWVDKDADAHKFLHGSAVVLSGGFGATGAARLAARGALRIGAGLVTLAVPGAAQVEVAQQITALMMTLVDGADTLAARLQDVRINAVCVGPGLGLERARALVPTVLRAKHRPAVCLDADALSTFADDPEAFFALLHEGCVLTPHGGEFARLFPDIAAKLSVPARAGPAYSKVDATRAAAARAGCVVLFKGPDTVIAHPDGRCSVHAASGARAAPWLATAGAGDVLAGFITGLLARGLAPMMAAEAATYLHVECARSFGPGLIAEDLPEELPKVFAALGRF